VTIRPSRPANAEPVSKVILQNVKVLAVGKEIDSNDKNRNQANPVTVATLLVNPEESEKLALAANEGRLLLTLRSWTDSLEVATEGSVPSMLLAEAGGRQAEEVPLPAPVAAAAPVAARRTRAPVRHPETAPPRNRDVVEILRGDRFEERKFDAKGKQ
jgi:pilus assembly protein CpaB